MLITDHFHRIMALGSEASASPNGRAARSIALRNRHNEPTIPAYAVPQRPAREWGCQYISDEGKCGEQRHLKSSYCRDHHALCYEKRSEGTQ